MKRRSARKQFTWRPAFNPARLRRPSPRDDLRRHLVARVAPSAGKRLKGFETPKQMKSEKARRARSLELLAQDRPHRQSELRRNRRAARLGKLLRRATRASDLPSFANPLFMRGFRRRFLGEILRLVRGLPAEEVRIYTLTSPKWRRPASRLTGLDPYKLRESLRTILIKVRLDDLPGWVIACFHNEHDRTTDTDQPHFHVVVVGEKYLAFEALRKLEMFQSCKEVSRPILCQALVNPVRQISYLVKGYWLQTVGKLNEKTGKVRRSRHRRLREPRHAESILFLHKQRFPDMIWMHGISIKNGRLVPGGRR